MGLNASKAKSISKATGHFWYQRITSIALIPLSIWVLVFLNKVLNASYTETVAWVVSPVNAAVIATWIVAVFWHTALGIRVVIEDYVSTISVRHWMIRLSNLIFVLLGFTALFVIVFIIYTEGLYGFSL